MGIGELQHHLRQHLQLMHHLQWVLAWENMQAPKAMNVFRDGIECILWWIKPRQVWERRFTWSYAPRFRTLAAASEKAWMAESMEDICKISAKVTLNEGKSP